MFAESVAVGGLLWLLLVIVLILAAIWLIRRI